MVAIGHHETIMRPNLNGCRVSVHLVLVYKQYLGSGCYWTSWVYPSCRVAVQFTPCLLTIFRPWLLLDTVGQAWLQIGYWPMWKILELMKILREILSFISARYYFFNYQNFFFFWSLISFKYCITWRVCKRNFKQLLIYRGTYPIYNGTLKSFV